MVIAVIDSLSQSVNWLAFPAAERESLHADAKKDAVFLRDEWKRAEGALEDFILHKYMPSGYEKCEQVMKNRGIRRLLAAAILRADKPDFLTGASSLAGFEEVFETHFAKLQEWAGRHPRASLLLEEMIAGPAGSYSQEIPYISEADFSRSLDKWYEMEKLDMRLATAGQPFNDNIENEIKRRKLQLDAWTENTAAHDIAFDAAAMLRERAKHGQTLMSGGAIFVPFTPTYSPYGPDTSSTVNEATSSFLSIIGQTLSTSQGYKFGFGFAMDMEHAGPGQSSAVYLLDERIMDVLQKAPGRLGEQVLREFQGVANMANHDYVHSAVFPFRNAGHDSPIAKARAAEQHDWDETFVGETQKLEAYSLITHRQNMQYVFAGRPGTKEAIIQKAVRYTGLISRLRDTAKEQGLHLEQAQDMSQFMLQTYLQRLHTFIAPDDPAMKPLIAAIDTFGVTPETVNSRDVRESINGGVYDALLTEVKPPAHLFNAMYPTADKLMHAMLAGELDDYPSQRVIATAHMWKQLLAGKTPDEKGQYQLTGYEVLRRNIGGLFQMIHDADRMNIAGKVMTMPEITQDYVRQFKRLASKAGFETGMVAQMSEQSFHSAQQHAREQQARLQALHITELRAMMGQLEEKLTTPEDIAAAAAFKRTLDDSQRTSRFMPRQVESWSAASKKGEEITSAARSQWKPEKKARAAQAIAEVAQRIDPAIASHMAPHLAAFATAIQSQSEPIRL